MRKNIRLRAYLMQTGEFERSYNVIKIIESGKVLVEGKKITNPEYHIKKTDKIKIMKNGKSRILKIKKHIYIILNKPSGFVCQKTKEEKSVYDLVNNISEIDEKTKKSLFCVGRLDRETEGLIILTNDGKLSNRLMQPERHIEKTYLVETKKPILNEDLKKLEDGLEIKLSDTKEKVSVKALRTKIISETKAEIIIDEGKKRQIKLMFKVIGNKIIYLKRIAIGNLKLENLDLKGKNYLIVDKKIFNDIYSQKDYM